MTRVQPAKLNITRRLPVGSLPLPPARPPLPLPGTDILPRTTGSEENQSRGKNEVGRGDGHYLRDLRPAPAAKCRFQKRCLARALPATFRVPRSVIADTRSVPRRAAANYCPLHRDDCRASSCGSRFTLKYTAKLSEGGRPRGISEPRGTFRRCFTRPRRTCVPGDGFTRGNFRARLGSALASWLEGGSVQSEPGFWKFV